MRVNNPLKSFPFAPKKISSFEDQKRIFQELKNDGYKLLSTMGDMELSTNEQFNTGYPYYIHELRDRKHVTWTYDLKRWNYESK